MTEAEDKDLREMTTLILRPDGCLSDQSTNGWQAKTFMGCNPVTAVEPPELTIHLQKINQFAQTLMSALV